VKAERVAEDQRFGNRRDGEVNPQVDRRRRIQPRAIDAGDLLGLAVAVNEDRDQP
jgi:hypothetical protein